MHTVRPFLYKRKVRVCVFNQRGAPAEKEELDGVVGCLRVRAIAITNRAAWAVGVALVGVLL